MDALTEVGTSYMDMKEGPVRTVSGHMGLLQTSQHVCMYAAVRIPRGGHGAARLQSLRALATH